MSISKILDCKYIAFFQRRKLLLLIFSFFALFAEIALFTVDLQHDGKRIFRPRDASPHHHPPDELVQ